MGVGGAVECPFQPGTEGRGVGCRRTWHSLGRHHPGSELAHDLLPDRGVVTDPGQIQMIELDARGLQFPVVTTDAVAVQEGSITGQRRRSRSGGLRGNAGAGTPGGAFARCLRLKGSGQEESQTGDDDPGLHEFPTGSNRSIMAVARDGPQASGKGPTGMKFNPFGNGGARLDGPPIAAALRPLVLSALVFLVLLPDLPVAAGRMSPNRLVEAAKAGDGERLRSLLSGGEDVNQRQADGATALHWAAHRDELENALVLIGAGADVKAANDLGVHSLWLACVNGSASMVKVLLAAGADPNAAPSNGETPLMHAGRSGSGDAVELLLQHGAKLTAKTPLEEQTALMWALAEKHAEVSRILIEHGAEVSARSRFGFTPLLIAARAGDLEGARALLAAGVDPNETASSGESALVVATVRGHVPLALWLLEQGADPNANGSGYTALHWAAGTWETEMTGPKGIVARPGHEWGAMRGLQEGKLELVQALLARGADPDARLLKHPPRFGYTADRKRPAGMTPFLLAAMAGDAGLMQVLVTAGASPRLAADDMTTPLMAAAGVRRNLTETRVTEEQSLRAVRLALESGADVNAANRDGDTALHGATRIKSPALVQLLVDHGAEVNVLNREGQTPLFVARHYFHPGSPPLPVPSETADLLRRLGARETLSEGVVE